MFPTDAKTWVLYILLTVVLGAIGSGFWEKAFKPFFTMTSRILLQASTFGFATARDSIYKEIARRSLNRPILFILFLLVMVASMLLGFASFEYNQTHLPEDAVIKLAQDKEREMEAFKNMPAEVRAARVAELNSKIYSIKRKGANIQLLGAFWFAVIIFYSFIRNSYISSAICYFDQCLAICSPYLSAEEQIKLFAQYASISSRKDYLLLINSFEDVAQTHNFELPYFSTL